MQAGNRDLIADRDTTFSNNRDLLKIIQNMDIGRSVMVK